MDIMEVIKTEKSNEHEASNYNLWRAGVEKDIKNRNEVYPTLDICRDYPEECSQVEITGLLRFFCGIIGLEWR